MNESLKQKVERAVGDAFVEWLNRTTGSEFQFECTGTDPPDLVYRDGDKTLPVEIATSYYDAKDAIARWEYARKDPTAPAKWPLTNPDQTLIADINNRIAEKCLATYDLRTVLVIGIYPAITTKAEFEELKNSIAIPSSIPFTAIYVAGVFPHSSDGQGGYFCWRVG